MVLTESLKLSKSAGRSNSERSVHAVQALGIQHPLTPPRVLHSVIRVLVMQMVLGDHVRASPTWCIKGP